MGVLSAWGAMPPTLNLAFFNTRRLFCLQQAKLERVLLKVSLECKRTVCRLIFIESNVGSILL